MKKQFNFKTRIVMVAISLLAVSMIILATSAYQHLSTLVKSNVDEYATLQMSSNGAKVHNYMSRIRHGVEQSADLFVSPASKAQIYSYLGSLGRQISASDVIVGYEDGLGYSHKHGEFNANKSDPRTRPWYQQAKAKATTVVTKMYQDKSTNKLMVTLATPLYQSGQFKGVVAADIAIQALDPLVERATFPGAMAALYDDTGLTISSTGEVDVPGESRLSDFEPLAELEQIMLAKQQNKFEFELLGVDKIAYFETVNITDNTTWFMLVAIDKSVMYSALGDSLVSSAITTVVLIMLSTIAIYVLLSIAYRPVEALKKTVNELSSGNGDLTQRLVVEREDDLGEISRDINTFIENLQAMMRDIAESSQHIATSVDDLQALRQNNNEILEAHRLETSQVATALNEMSASSNDVAHNTEHAVTSTTSTNEHATHSKEVVFGATQNVSDLVLKVDESATQIHQMGQEIDNISAVLKVIGDIAEQTNLLALNAAIEAARAGEQGRGFAVVADEVRALASRTQDSTTEIHNTINRLNASSQSVISGIESTKTSCEEASQQTHLVVESLDQIVNSVGDINDLNIQIAAAAKQQSSVSEEINRNMVTISEMVDQVAASSDEVNGATTILASANSNLTRVVSQFKL
ncbi:methyl-accepting chemotaxis protein [Thalassotalea euphylliae]|uniref:Methyl-accepting chemotaxis protein n=1 Tax=Thalassotalea euphylliae TaxID=1655234 RepID=A0A3E0TMI1_9GAMM|nr:methyl-accepting chemotaxis protein [Thalassotalea euphylliae]REL25557.1 methyl-accepting chemotaxis protein [Thalassotalea euphylliae]